MVILLSLNFPYENQKCSLMFCRAPLCLVRLCRTVPSVVYSAESLLRPDQTTDSESVAQLDPCPPVSPKVNGSSVERSDGSKSS